jgi:hypothetical protein
MTSDGGAADRIIDTLRERAKELQCLYHVHELLGRETVPVSEVLRAVVEAIPPGWQYPADCFAKIALGGDVYEPPRAAETPWVQHADIIVRGTAIGGIDVFYTHKHPDADEGPFLKEERKLVDTIAGRLADFAIQRGMAPGVSRRDTSDSSPSGWSVIVEFLRRTDPHLLARVARRMVNHLCWMGIEGAQVLLARDASTARDYDGDALDGNRPIERSSADVLAIDADEVFALAGECLSGDAIVAALEKWMRDDKAGFLIETLDHAGTTIGEIAQALDRFQQLGIEDSELSRPTHIGLRVALARRLLTDDPAFIEVAKDSLTTSDYGEVMHRVIASSTSHGKLGGKSAGLLLAAALLRNAREYADLLGEVRVPRTWYIASDALLDFIEYNHLDDVYTRKYLELDQIRRDYPHIVQMFKHSRFPAEIVKGLSVALDEFQDRPLIVRSSSLLEDRVGAAFSGKYKSLFLSNRGSKRERLGALMDAIAEVYASIFGPDPIEYRRERGLLHFHEEMAVMIQEVVGTPVGRYFLPTYAGVAFTHNEVRWSPRIRREDGLVRLVPGLGTRAVDRLSDDYSVLIAPGQPGLRVTATPEEALRYAPHKLDVIDLEEGRFATVDAETLARDIGRTLPGFQSVFSIVERDGTRRAAGFEWDPSHQPVVVTFDGLLDHTAFLPTIRAMLRALAERVGGPVDVEFASDGRQVYLLQCRAQSFAPDAAPASIPDNVPPERVVFSANQYVPNGRVTRIQYVVYVDPDRYQALATAPKMREVGRAVGRLNERLPKRRFILLGPGRWGSRGDVRLGVSVAYSDISNTAMLLEIARQRGHYVPDVSFGTHFFQDLVESNIRYLPLYPDDPAVVFNEEFLHGSANRFAELVPEHAHLADVVHVVDVPQVTGGLTLSVLMNAEQDRAIGVLTPLTRTR